MNKWMNESEQKSTTVSSSVNKKVWQKYVSGMSIFLGIICLSLTYTGTILFYILSFKVINRSVKHLTPTPNYINKNFFICNLPWVAQVVTKLPTVYRHRLLPTITITVIHHYFNNPWGRKFTHTFIVYHAHSIMPLAPAVVKMNCRERTSHFVMVHISDAQLVAYRW
jgi:hypothetical protein